mmetsp:Transcript_25142/g.47268  ORF Transcript_25142/g.47268 Transcript_25142/m.47268 type:complete len:609 (+) Transcript_25142:262-2088(+)|eukprot:CAMPEP_0182493022 /NCGR_PEP_ID=MMETSP1321-20130603/2050_1 /TAXON_ID=91990 /ORGANISM="Bolidomonas sp., Strain RCC1657" /LENGTH=608 /DNA_ID=CAMNT_0024695683 /DNA_START=265 /DNA_END=2091 /DNA_ORIENTATION=+
MGLQYDNSAFYYFLLSSLTLYLLPSYLYIFKTVVTVFFKKEEYNEPRTSKEKEKIERIKLNKKKESVLTSKSFLINLAITLVLTIVFILLASSLSSDSEIMSFDPYEILSIDRSATTKDIKSAYRKKSLKYHPDKNPDNPTAQATFMLIAKAYEALTDPVAKSNWEKFGNPDGKQSLEISIGLPTFLLSAEWRSIILLTYLFSMVVLLPTVVWYYYNDSSKYGEMGIMYKTWGWLNHSLTGQSEARTVPEVLAGCAEFHEMVMPKDIEGEKAKMAELQQQVRESMIRPRYNHVLVVKGNMLLHSHVLRLPLSPEYEAQRLAIVKGSPLLLKAMVEHSHQKMWLKTATEVIKFSQFLVQALWINDSPMQQLGLTRSECKSLPPLVQFLSLPLPSRSSALLKSKVPPSSVPDVLSASSSLPLLSVAASVFVEDDEDTKIYQNDLITVRVTSTRLNVPEGGSAQPVLGEGWEGVRKEGWWCILCTREGKIVHIQKVTDEERTFKHDIKFMAPPKGKYEMKVMMFSDDYVGLDKDVPVSFEVLDPALLPAYKVHEDDAALDDEPTMFEQMMAGNIEEESESEEEGTTVNKHEDSDSEDEDSSDEEVEAKKNK